MPPSDEFSVLFLAFTARRLGVNGLGFQFGHLGFGGCKFRDSGLSPTGASWGETEAGIQCQALQDPHMQSLPPVSQPSIKTS